MRKPSLMVVFLLAMTVTACSGAPANRSSGPPDDSRAQPEQQLADSSDVADPDRKICKITQVTGTRIQKAKVCLTAREWNDMAKTDRDVIEESQRDAAYGIAGGN